MKRERFDAKNVAHAKLLRRAGLCLDRYCMKVCDVGGWEDGCVSMNASALALTMNPDTMNSYTRALKRAKRARVLAKKLCSVCSPCETKDERGQTWKLVESNELMFDSAHKVKRQ